MSLFGPKYKPIVGLDIGTSTIRAMEVRPAGAGWRLHRWHHVPSPPTLLVDGKIKKSDEAVDLIKAFHKEGKFTTNKVAIATGGPSIISKKILVEKMTEMELEDQIALEAEEYIPFDIEEVFLDFQILGDADEKMAVLLTACKKDFVNDKLDLCREAGLDPIILDLDVFCLANAFATFSEMKAKKKVKDKSLKKNIEKGKKGAEVAREVTRVSTGGHSPGGDAGRTETSGDSGESVVALANVGGQYLNTIVLVNGTVDYTRDLSFGAKSMVAEIVERTGLTADDVQRALQKRRGGSEPHSLGDAWENIIRPFEEKLAAQIKQSLDFFQASRIRKEKIHSVLLSGGIAATDGIDQRLGQILGIPVEIFSPSLKLKHDRGRGDFSTGVAPGFSVSLGLALRGLS